jgi:D-glycero-D-manno-heptose 1,7-bisphosphate phosphatase
MPDIFLDRDGVINENRADYVRSWEQFRFLPGALQALAVLTQAGFRIFVVTNQAGVNRGLVSPEALAEIHRNLRRAARQAGARIEAIRYCPHRPDEQCSCRKPRPGMLFDLAWTHQVSLGEAFMVGDAASDVAAGRSAGCRTVMVRTGRGASQLQSPEIRVSRPDLVANDLLSAARLICSADRQSAGWRAPLGVRPAAFEEPQPPC